jgi:hypothetical protein
MTMTTESQTKFWEFSETETALLQTIESRAVKADRARVALARAESSLMALGQAIKAGDGSLAQAHLVSARSLIESARNVLVERD